MTRTVTDLQARYTAALVAHVEAPSEATLNAAYEIGRTLLNEGLGVLEISALHHHALDAALGRRPGTNRAAEFVAESLSPFEMSLRGYREANQRLRTVNAALELARLEAEAANRELEAFSYSVAHDLRAPLRSVDGFSLALLEDYGDLLSGDGTRYLTYVRQAAQRMAQLIDDLLALSRVSRAEFTRRPVDLSALARTVATRLAEAAPERTATVAVADDLTCEGDIRLLTIALENLLGNAWKFTGKRADAHVEVGAMSDGSRTGQPIFFVRDNGAGFDMAHAAKLFGVFQRLHSEAEFEGTGIGLATVQRIIRRHGGQIWAEGAVGQGATFFFTLDPATPVPATTVGR